MQMRSLLIGALCAALLFAGCKENASCDNDSDEDFTNRYLVIVDKKVGFVDRQGNMVIEPQYDDSWGFYEGVASVEVDGSYGFIDTMGKMIIQPTYEYATSFSDGLCAVMVDSKWGYIDRSGKMVIAPQYVDASYFTDGTAIVANEDYRYGCIDRKGNAVIPLEYDEIEFIDNVVARALVGNKKILVDISGNKIWPK